MATDIKATSTFELTFIIPLNSFFWRLLRSAQDLRKELLKVEQVESDRRKGQVESMDKIVKARAQLEKKHFEDRQRIRMRLIEEATKNLNALKVEEDRILEKVSEP